jgi:uncharacterized protein YggE
MIRSLITAIFLLSFTSSFGHALTDNAPTGGIQASGQCLKKVAQDRGSVAISSSVVAASTKEASEQATKAHEKVKAEVAALRLKDPENETLNYSVNEECFYDNNKRTCKGFRATFTTRFETSEISRIGEIINVASNHSTEQISGLQTSVSPAKLKAEQESCLEVAARDAASKAQKLAAGAGVKVGKLMALNEQMQGESVTPMMPRVAYEALAANAASGGPAIDSKPIDLEVRVRATYAIVSTNPEG